MKTLELPGQMSLFDFTTEPRYGWCPACHTCWISNPTKPRKPEWYERNSREHAIQSDGRCHQMHEFGTREPFYTIAEIQTQVFADGGCIQYPRPYGYGGFYELGAKSRA